MPFYTSPCNPIRRAQDLDYQFHRKFIFSIIAFQLLSIIVAIIYSAIKNHQCRIMQKYTVQQKNTQTPPIQSTINNLQTQVLPTSHSIYGGFKSNKSLNDKKIMHLDSDCQNLPTFESIALKKKIKQEVSGKSEKNRMQKMKMKRQQPQEKQSSQQKNNQNLSDSLNQRSTQKVFTCEDKKSQIDSNTQQQVQFIKIGHLKVSKDKASIYFNIILGHFFICAALAIQISPQITTVTFSGIHCLLFIIISLNNIFFYEDEDKIVKQKTQTDLKGQERISIDFQVHLQVQDENNKVKNKIQTNLGQLKTKVNYTIIILMMLINLCLLSLSVMRMKQSYFNVTQSRCA